MTARESWKTELARLAPIAFVGIVLGITSAFVALAHPVEPLDPPLPIVDVHALSQISRADADARRRLDQNLAPSEIRSIGTAFLDWNVAAANVPNVGATSNEFERASLVRELREALGAARAKFGDK